MRVAIWLYRNSDIMARIIQAQTWRAVNHAAFEFVDHGLIIEASLTGVKLRPRDDSKLGNNKVWRFEYAIGDEQYAEALAFAKAHVGDKYDHLSLVAFVPTLRKLFRRTDPTVRDGSGKWICSELVEVLARKSGIHTIRLATPPAIVSPGDIMDSVRLDMASLAQQWTERTWVTLA